MQKHDNDDAARRQANDAAVRRLALENKLGWAQVCLMEDKRQGGTKQAYWEKEMREAEKELGKL